MMDLKGTEGIRSVRIGVVLSLIALGGFILWPVLSALMWAGILAILSMPLHRWLLVRIPRHAGLLPLPIILGWVLIFLGPVCWLLIELQDEASTAYEMLFVDEALKSDQLVAKVGPIPVIGPLIQSAVQSFPKEGYDVIGVIRNIIPIVGQSFGRLVIALSDQLFQLILSVITLYFFLKDGQSLIDSLKQGLTRMLGAKVTFYFGIIHATVHAVSLGIMGAALLQGVIATCGYLIFGVKTPILLGLLSVMASLVPVLGASLVWGPVALTFVFENQWVPAAGLTLWGLFIVHPADNILRPWVIGKLMHSPILLIILGVIGGILSLGLPGLFLGPCILAMLFQLWSSAQSPQRD